LIESGEDLADQTTERETPMQTATRELPIWRSLLFVPVNVPKFVATAHTRGSDAVILDLEDSVPPAEKATARTLIAAAAPKVAQSGADVVVRINQPIELAVRDIEAAISPAIHTLMLPKIDSAGHIRLLAELVDRIEAQKGMRVGHTKFMALIETPSAFARTDEIAAAHPRLISISLGSEDFAMEVGGEPATDVLFYPKQRVAIAAVANGLMPMGVIGSVADFMDLDGYRNSARLARRLGFRGAACIHPKHVDILNEEFGPKSKDVAWARRVIDVYEKAKAEGRASIQLDGKMVDVPIVVRAERIITEAARIEARAKTRARCGLAGCAMPRSEPC
jgi:citrate lyase subunit beta / citryl-CoA lyase